VNTKGTKENTRGTKENTRGTKENTKGTKTLVTAFVIFVPSFVLFVSAFQTPQRIVSLVPAVTEMLFAIGAGPQVVAVSSYDQDPPEVRTLPRVGALLDPDVERILSIRPDLVITYGSQADLQQQLERTSIAFFDYRHAGLADITVTMRRLGAATGHAREAGEQADRLEQRIRAIRARAASLPRPRTLLVFGRERGALRNIYASGGRGFLHDMLEAAGGRNVFADVARESVQATTELILARAPEVILEVRSADILTAEEAAREAASWAPLASVPAVRGQRVVVLTGRGLTVPGPRVADVVERMADALR
jgi:iron complex transport system substrate-binding protein